MSKSNTVANIHSNSRSSRVGVMQEFDIPEPKEAEHNMLKCPICNAIFASKEDYISHALAKHQPAVQEMEMSPATT
ncbi:MAG: hypothetical protein NWF00_06205 [Candidatus Bathyarchaeota archaeon]|nr:hypothetical protein [Candidatus Bathyarchaeota archaeon]